MVTTANQIKKIKEYNDLSENIISLTEEISNLDSIQNILFSYLPQDIVFYKSQRNNLVDKIKKSTTLYAQKLDQTGANFFVLQNREIKSKINETRHLIDKYNQALDKYLQLSYQKGFAEYGTIGQIDMLGNRIIENAQQNKNQKLATKIKEILDLKNQYISDRNVLYINKLKISLSEAEALTILTNPSDKISILSDLEKLSELIRSLYDLDRAIGIGNQDGQIGKLHALVNNISLNLHELRQLISSQTQKAILWAYIWIVISLLVILCCLWGLYKRINKYIHRPLEKLSRFLSEMVKGKLPEKLTFKRHDEITQMGNYLNSLVEGLQDKAEFATNIGHNNLSANYSPLSEEDILGNALIDMQKSLRKAEIEDQKYKMEEKKRIWSNEGLAKFGEILRLHSNDINILADQIIQYLVKYLNAIQGSLYFINDDDKDNIYIELYSAYAYDRKKYIKQHIPIGEGLVGTAVLEKEKIFITDIPENYLTITSGLGEAPPACILIMPLKTEDEVIGVVELASFNIFEAHEIEFVERIGQTIASTITSVKINLQTAKLLEKSQRQAEEMAEQEEEMRQNMEELRTTQEDFARREAELQGFLNAIHLSAMLMTLDNSGIIIDANQKLISFLQSKPEDIIGRSVIDFINLSRENFDLLWEQLPLGKSKTIESQIRISSGIELKVRQIFSPVFDKSANMVRVLLEFIDLSQQAEDEKLLEIKNTENEKLKFQINQYNKLLNINFLRCEFSPRGKYIDVNENYCQTVGFLPSELIGKDYTEYLKDDEKEHFQIIWNEVMKGKPFSGMIKRTQPTGGDVWLMTSMVPIINENNDIEKVILLAQDVTERKLKYQLLEEANKEIERLRKNVEKNQSNK
jgi:PAS domain S-box-containing protein